MIDQHDVDLTGRFSDVENWIGKPIYAGHGLAVEGYFLPQRTANALHYVAFDAFHQPVRIDDLPAVMGDRELARPNLAGRAIDINFRDHRHARAVSLPIGDAAARHLVAGLI